MSRALVLIWAKWKSRSVITNHLKIQVQNTDKVEGIHAFLISNTFISNARLKFAKNQAKAKQHSEAELLLFENYSLSSFMLSSKNIKKYSEKWIKVI